MILGMPNSNWTKTKTTILEATPGVIPGIDGNPHERFSFASAFSERSFKNSGGPCAQENHYENKSLRHFVVDGDVVCSQEFSRKGGLMDFVLSKISPGKEDHTDGNYA